MSPTRWRFGWLLAIFDDDLKFQTACPKAANQTGHCSQIAGELNTFQLQGDAMEVSLPTGKEIGALR